MEGGVRTLLIGSYPVSANRTQKQNQYQARENSQREADVATAARVIAHADKEKAAESKVTKNSFSLSSVLREAAKEASVKMSTPVACTSAAPVAIAASGGDSFFNMFGLSEKPWHSTRLVPAITVPLTSSLSALLREAKEAPNLPPTKQKAAESELSLLDVVCVYKEKAELTPAFASLNNVIGSLTSSLFGGIVHSPIFFVMLS